MTTWGQLTKGTWIVCPGDGRPEKVTNAYRAGRNRASEPIMAVRTTRHDHFKPVDGEVEVTERPER